MIEFQVNTKPIGKARPRLTNSGIAFTPRRTKDFEEVIGLAAKEIMARGKERIS